MPLSTESRNSWQKHRKASPKDTTSNFNTLNIENSGQQIQIKADIFWAFKEL